MTTADLELGASPARVQNWLPRAATAVSVLGAGVAAYLTAAHYTTPALLACSDRGAINCAAVTTSPESTLAGVPVAVAGLAFFAVMAGLNHPRAWRAGGRAGSALAAVRLAGAVGGMGFALYLVATELLVIGAICLYCTAAHLLAFALFVLVTAGTAQRGLRSTGPAAQEGLALDLVEAAPDAVGLPDA